MKAKFGLFASVIFIVVTLLFSAFGNGTGPVMLETDVLSLQQGATIHGMNLAMLGKNGAQVLEKPILDAAGNPQSYYLFVWPFNNGWGFVGMDPAKQEFFSHMKEIIGNGNFTTPKNIKELTDMLKANGWKVIPGSSLPTGLQSAIISAANPAWMQVLMKSPNIMLITPIGPLENMNDPDWSPIYMIAPKEDA